jgi:hypothetical protein
MANFEKTLAKSREKRFVSGHDFSRAEKPKQFGALAPAALSPQFGFIFYCAAHSREIKGYSAESASFKPKQEPKAHGSSRT